MRRASNSERAKRINSALALLKLHKSLIKVAEALAVQYGISKRQAYRYVHEAESIGKQVSIPDTKIAFTVKLSKKLIQGLREYARSKGQSLSKVVTQALETLLQKDRGSG